MTSLITLIRQRYPTDAHAAALLGISRQAYSQAIKRNRLSNETALRCADLLGIDRAAALLANCPAAEHMPAPVIHPTPDTPPEVHITRTDNTNYACFRDLKKPPCTAAALPKVAERINASVPPMAATSPVAEKFVDDVDDALILEEVAVAVIAEEGEPRFDDQPVTSKAAIGSLLRDLRKVAVERVQHIV